MTPLEHSSGGRRVLLVDLDWRESDLVPSLMRDPAYAVALVAGQSIEDPGLRVARLCGAPHSTDLADLTREIFDLALLGAGSPRREHIARLLTALGTPVCTPDDLAAAREHPERRVAESPAPAPAAPVDAVDFDAAFPDVSDPPAPQGSFTPAAAMHAVAVPGVADSDGIDRWLARLRDRTSSTVAEFHLGTADAMTRRCHIGPDDPLLDALVPLAARLGAAQVVERLGPGARRAWGAWPLRAAGHHAVLAAGGFDPQQGPPVWAGAADQLRLAWTAEPADPDASPGCLTREAFAARVRLVVERAAHEAFAFSVHRLTFDGPEPAVAAWCDRFPATLRGTDGVCRGGGPSEVLLLFCGNDAAYGGLRRRLVATWEACSQEAGGLATGPILDERIVLEGPAQAEAFIAAAANWIQPTQP